MVSSEIDLIALANELIAVGLTVEIAHRTLYADTPMNPGKVRRRFVVTDYGHVHLGKWLNDNLENNGTILKDDWRYLDIIRRYI